jgi:phage-related protein
MASVGVGVYEIRIHEAGEHRVFYLAKREEAIYVLHAFHKKSQKTRQKHIDLAKQRLKALEDY